MSTYDWEEVKRLAADFQIAQQSSSSQKLSERNCVEIIAKLTQLKLVDVIFTTDGKTYVTPKYLRKEIKDELIVRNGRVNLIDVAKNLNVEFNVISSLAQDIIKEDSNVKLILGQLIDRNYVTHIAEEINEKLEQYGVIDVTELARSFDLPGDFIHSVIKESCGKNIVGVKQDRQDLQVYYTENYLNRNKAIVRGALIAITKPTLISTVIGHCGIGENIFFSLIDNLIESKQIPGIITERCGSICSYIPQIYLKTQSEWVKNFYEQNGYLEYDALTRVGINDPKTFITKSLDSEENLQYLKTCAVGRQLLDQIEAAVEEVYNSRLWINVLSILPTVIDCDDAEIILRDLITKRRNLSEIRSFAQTYAVSEQFLNSLQTEIVEKTIPSKVNDIVNSGVYEQYLIESKISNKYDDDNQRKEPSRKEERKKRANVGKSGGGTQGRETRTKTTKKKYGKSINNRVESDDETVTKPSAICSLEFLSKEMIRSIVENDESFQDEEFDYSEFVDELIEYFYSILNKIALSQAEVMYEMKLANRNNSKRKMNAELQDSIITSYQDFKQYSKGIKDFNDEDCQQLLNKYLLKTTGSQLVNACFSFVSDKNEEINTPEARQQLLSTIDNKELKESFSKLHKVLSGNSIEEFSVAVDDVLAVLNIMMKKMDKKKERSLMESHKQALIDKLKETNDPSLVLHLVCLILYQNTTQNMVNASGRFVSNILNFLRSHLPPTANEELQQYHHLVLKAFKLDSSNDECKQVNEELTGRTPALKDLIHVVMSK